MFSLDFEDKYCNLDLATLFEFVSNAIHENGLYFQNSSGISVRGFMNFLVIYLDSRIVEYEEQIFRQKKGVGIGSCLAPLLREIFLLFLDVAMKARVG